MLLDSASSTSKSDHSIKLHSLPDDVLFHIFAALAQNSRLKASFKCRLRDVFLLAYSHSRLYAAYKRFLLTYGLKPSPCNDTFNFINPSSDHGDQTSFSKSVMFWLRVRAPGITSADLVPGNIFSPSEFATVVNSLVESAPRLRHVTINDIGGIASSAASFVASVPLLRRLTLQTPQGDFLRTVCHAVQPTLRVLDLIDIPSNHRPMLLDALDDLAQHAHISRLVVRFEIVSDLPDSEAEFEFHDESPIRYIDNNASFKTDLTPTGIAARAFRHPEIQYMRLHDLNLPRGDPNCSLCKTSSPGATLNPTWDFLESHSHSNYFCQKLHGQRSHGSVTNNFNDILVNPPRARVYGVIAGQERLCKVLSTVSSLVQQGVRFLFRIQGFSADGIPSLHATDADMLQGVRVIRAELRQLLNPRIHGPRTCEWGDIQMVEASCVACEASIYASKAPSQRRYFQDAMNILFSSPNMGLFQHGPPNETGLLALARAIAVSATSLKTVSILLAYGDNFNQVYLRVLGVLFRYAPQLSVLNVGIEVLVSASFSGDLDALLNATKTLRVFHITATSSLVSVVQNLVAKHSSRTRKLRPIIQKYLKYLFDLEGDGDRFIDTDFTIKNHIAWSKLALLFFAYYPTILKSISNHCRRVQAVVIHDTEPCADVFVPKELIQLSIQELERFQQRHPNTDLSSPRNMLNAWNEHVNRNNYSTKRATYHLMREFNVDGSSSKKPKLQATSSSVRRPYIH